MSAVDVILIAVLAFLCFGALAMYKMDPDKLRFYMESRLAKIGFEISRSGRAEKPQDEIEPGRDG